MVRNEEFLAQVKRIDDLLELVGALEKRIVELEEKNSAQAAKIEQVEKEQKNAPAAGDALWSTIAKRNVKKSTEQLKVINVMADEGKERLPLSPVPAACATNTAPATAHTAPGEGRMI